MTVDTLLALLSMTPSAENCIVIEGPGCSVTFTRRGEVFVSRCPFHATTNEPGSDQRSLAWHPRHRILHCFWCGLSKSAENVRVEQGGKALLDKLDEILDMSGGGWNTPRPYLN